MRKRVERRGGFAHLDVRCKCYDCSLNDLDNGFWCQQTKHMLLPRRYFEDSEAPARCLRDTLRR